MGTRGAAVTEEGGGGSGAAGAAVLMVVRGGGQGFRRHRYRLLRRRRRRCRLQCRWQQRWRVERALGRIVGQSVMAVMVVAAAAEVPLVATVVVVVVVVVVTAVAVMVAAAVRKAPWLHGAQLRSGRTLRRRSRAWRRWPNRCNSARCDLSLRCVRLGGGAGNNVTFGAYFLFFGSRRPAIDGFVTTAACRNTPVFPGFLWLSLGQVELFRLFYVILHMYSCAVHLNRTGGETTWYHLPGK